MSEEKVEKPRISTRIAAIAESATLAVDAKAKALKAAGKPVIGFGAGEPDFPTPDYIVQAAIDAAAKPANHRYTPTPGLPELRDAIVAKTLRDSKYVITPDQVLVTNGGKQAVYQAFATIINPGDEVIHQLGTDEGGGFLRRVMIGRHMSGKLEPPQPSTQTDQVGHLSILEFQHRVLDILLRGVEFLTQSLPVIPVTEFKKTFASRREALTGTQRVGFPDQCTACIDNELFLTCNRCNEAVGNQRAELDRRLKAIGKCFLEIKGSHEIRRGRLEKFQIAENPAHHRGRDFVHSEFFTKVLRGTLVD
jgi:hypothetical protein